MLPYMWLLMFTLHVRRIINSNYDIMSLGSMADQADCDYLSLANDQCR